MCKAIDDMMEARRCEGVKALVETCKEFGLSRVDVLLKVKDKFALSEESAEGYLKKYWK